jgi:hypothetical protein
LNVIYLQHHVQEKCFLPNPDLMENEKIKIERSKREENMGRAKVLI